VPEREFRVLVHEEDGSYWGEVVGLPGCFASGHTLDELREAIVEAITLCAEGSDVDVSGLPPRATGRVDEMRVLVSA
jgi:predicted RNase H-like HicB family nuclease